MGSHIVSKAIPKTLDSNHIYCLSTAEKRFSRAKRHFAALNEQSSLGGDPLDEWLSSPVILSSLDPISYWSAVLKAENSPAWKAENALACMALDFLLVPASSTDVEPAFSSGGLDVSKLRHLLSDESTHAASILSLWFNLEGAIPCKELIQQFKDKKRHPKKKQKTDGNSEVSQRTAIGTVLGLSKSDRTCDMDACL
ncbi:hypothetical protein B0H34DRAFT_806796 [Crassisporium funariophilum]|nr:hypothetical protein B0H34DRAFT_806796 [Crassisporium funariophilum]